MKLLNPIPKKEHNNKAEFFNENYWKIIFGPGYAYMQMHFITTAMEEYENNPNPPTFEELIVERLR
jgi:hypothetical protein